MPRRRHGRMMLPAISGGIIGFHRADHAINRAVLRVIKPFLAPHAPEAPAQHRHAMAGTWCRDRRTLAPGIACRIIDVMQAGIILKRVETPAGDMDAPFPHHNAGMITPGGNGTQQGPFIGLRIINLIPCNAGAFGGRICRAADVIDLAAHSSHCPSTARARHGRNGRPTISRDIINECLVVRGAVLFGETTQRINPPGIRNHADMIGAARQRCRFLPTIRCRVIDMMIGLIHLALGIAANHMQLAGPGRGPGHFAAR